MSLATAPKVVHDAMQVVTRLGFRYLWVDRYCIPQDDAALKESQIRDMGRIYAASALTIIAAAGDGPDYGLVGVSSRLRAKQLHVTIDHTRFFRQCEYPEILVQGSKWNTRGWTYQEGLLARRRLVFTEEEVYFQCQSMDCLESVGAQLEIYNNSANSRRTGTIRPVFPIAVSYESPIELLERIREYFVRDLSVDSDALEAFSGVFELFRLTKNPVYSLCGLPILNPNSVSHQKWSETVRMYLLVLALCWRSDGKLCRRVSFPSWTWAGWKPGSKDTKIDFEVLNMLSVGGHITIPRIFSLPPNIVVTIQNDDGVALDWERDFEKILDLYTIEQYLGPLQVTGWTFTFLFMFEEPWRTKPAPLFASSSWWDPLRDCLQPEQLGSRKEKAIEVTALVLFRTEYNNVAEREGTHPRNCTTGLLFLVRIDSSRLERLTYHTATNFPDFFDVNYQKHARGLGIDIKYEQVCIV
jgi:hypothetical protein